MTSPAIGATAYVVNLASELLFARPSARAVDSLVNITLDRSSHVSYADWRALDEAGVLDGLAAYHIEGSVVRLVVADAAVLVTTGLVIGLALAALVTQPLAMFLVDGLSPHDPLPFAGTALLFAAVSAAATIPPVRRAIGVGPLVALRTE